MQTYYKICVLFIFGIPLISSLENDHVERNQKLISSFQIVRFPNDGCVGSGARNGTCYTSQECADKGGTSSGSCADGFGVCCTFVITDCGSTSSENMTAWTIPANLPATATTCGLSICPPSTDICSLRLDFTQFLITGPSTVTSLQVRRTLGTPTGNMGDSLYLAGGSSFATNCLLDVFTTTSVSPSSNPPAVCGNLAGEHMYVEADADRCNMLQFNLAATAGVLPVAGRTNERGVTTIATRNWDIKVTQIECTSELLPPAGCTKYYFGAGNVRLTSYNFGAGVGSTHLASQHERFCIRRELGNCIGCFSAAAVANVQLSGLQTIAATHTQAGGCCGYHTMRTTGANGIANTALASSDGLANVDTVSAAIAAAQASTQMGFDCLIIPGAFVTVNTAAGVPLAHANAATAITNLQNTLINPANTGNVPAPPQICGNNLGLGIGAASLAVAANDNGDTIIANNQAFGTRGQAAAAANLSICTRNVPFTLEFMSDDLDGLGAGAGPAFNAENSNGQTANRGFQIDVTQVACTAAAG